MNVELFELLVTCFNRLEKVYSSSTLDERNSIDMCLKQFRRDQILKNIRKFPAVEIFVPEKDKPLSHVAKVENYSEIRKLFEKDNVTVIFDVGFNYMEGGHANEIVLRRENDTIYCIYIEPHGVYLDELFNKYSDENEYDYDEMIELYNLDPLKYVKKNYKDMFELFLENLNKFGYQFLKRELNWNNTKDLSILVNDYLNNLKNKPKSKENENKFNFMIFIVEYLNDNEEYKTPIDNYILEYRVENIERIHNYQKEVVDYLFEEYLDNYSHEKRQGYKDGKLYNIIYIDKQYPIQEGDTVGFCTTVSAIATFIDMLIQECIGDVCYKDIKYEGSLYVDLFTMLLEQFVYRENVKVKPFSICKNKKNYMCAFNIFFGILLMSSNDSTKLSLSEYQKCQYLIKKKPEIVQIVNETINEMRNYVFTKLPKKAQKKYVQSLYEDVIGEMY